jgi:acyl-CoA synthetase (AMP-forming)/AMP-acid ligase II
MTDPASRDPIVKAGWSARSDVFDMSGVVRSEDGRLVYQQLPASTGEILRRDAEKTGQRDGLVEIDGPRLTYLRYWQESVRVAQGLARRGVHRGDRVAIRLPNGAAWAVAFFGCQLLGATAVPINIRLTEPETEYILRDAETGLVLDQDTYRAIAESGADADDDFALQALAQVNSTDIAAIFYTSGTTGRPKGAMLSHENIVASCENSRRMNRLDQINPLRSLIPVPLFHVTGCVSQLLATAHAGGTSVIMPQFSASRLLTIIQAEKVSRLTVVPAMLAMVVDRDEASQADLSQVVSITYGGSPMPASLIQKIRTTFPNAALGNGYGLSESAAGAVFLPDEYCDNHLNTVGFAAPVIEIDLLDVDERSGVGELAIRGQNVFLGYWRLPDATAEAFVDGWFRTGDVASIDDEGLVTIADRKKDVIIRGGENVYCAEVQNAIEQYPGVVEVAVFGTPDQILGETVCSVVVIPDGSVIDPDDLREWLRGRLSPYKLPARIKVSNEPLPRNAGGKVAKDVLREAASREWTNF